MGRSLLHKTDADAAPRCTPKVIRASCIMLIPGAAAAAGVGRTTVSRTIQGLNITFPQLPSCEPYYVVRGFGEVASFSCGSHAFRPHPPLSGWTILDVTLVSCNQTIDIRNCLPPPTTVYRGRHYFAPPLGKAEHTHAEAWRRRANVSDMDMLSAAATRFQREECSRDAVWRNESTKRICRRSPVDFYEYTTLKRIRLDEEVCFVGASHAQRMHTASMRLGMKRTRWVLVHFARDLKAAMVAGCAITMIHTGQWDLGWPEHTITPLTVFERDVRDMIRIVQSSVNQGYNTSLVLLSNDYNPLGDIILACPPTDWRRPDFIDTYNLALERIARDTYGVQYVDNNRAVLGVAWDSASDWCHPDNDVMDAIVHHSLHSIHRAR